MGRLERIVVVGASLAGLRACEALREYGFEGRLVLVGAEPHEPYDRPPLSKEILRGQWPPERTRLRKEGLDNLDLELRLGVTATALDARSRELRLSDASVLGFDGAVIATGADARRLGPYGPEAGVHVLRTIDDAVALRNALAGADRVAIVGAGFIGLEVAASCRARGLEVCVVEPQAFPLASVLGERVGAWFEALHRDEGVDMRTGVAVEAFEGDVRARAVRLSDGSLVEADLFVVGVGVRPATTWLEGSGLVIDDGVVCDGACRTSVPGIVAAGDVARWHHSGYGRPVRVEHWANAVEQARVAAHNLLEPGAAVQVYAPLPTFWSDQYGLKLQFAGLDAGGADVAVEVVGEPASRRFVALYGRNDRLVAVFTAGRARAFVSWCEKIGGRICWQEALVEARRGG